MFIAVWKNYLVSAVATKANRIIKVLIKELLLHFATPSRLLESAGCVCVCVCVCMSVCVCVCVCMCMDVKLGR